MNTDRDVNGPDARYQHFLLSLLSRREQFFTEVVQGERLGRKLRYSILTLLVLAAFCGAIVGSYSSLSQAVSAGIKLPLLYLLTFAVCFPAFFVVQILVGSRLRLMQVVLLVMATLALTSILLAALTPIAAFFLITGANYYFLVLLHIVLVLVAGMFGMYALHEGLALVCEQHTVYPKKAMTIMRVWAFIFAFVGIQMAWNLRPFLGDRDQSFKVFRNYEGNFYTAVIYSLDKLFEAKPDQGSSSSVSPRARPLGADEFLRRMDADSTKTSGSEK